MIHAVNELIGMGFGAVVIFGANVWRECRC